MPETVKWTNWLLWFEQRNGYLPRHLRVDRITLETLAREARMPVDFMPLWYITFCGIPIEARPGSR